MNNYKIITPIYLVIFLLTFARFLPIFGFREFIGNSHLNLLVFLEYGALLFSILFTIGLFIFMKEGKKYVFIIVICYAALCFLRPQLQDFDNRLIIFLNKNNDLEEFSNPILGMRKEIKDEKAYFYFNEFLYDYEGGRDALIYDLNSKVEMPKNDEFISEASVKNVYDDSWWWFKEHAF